MTADTHCSRICQVKSQTKDFKDIVCWCNMPYLVNVDMPCNRLAGINPPL